MTSMFLIFGLISSDVNILHSPKSQGVCPKDWIFLDTRCMYISSDSASWPIAVKQCEQKKAQLASIRDPAAVLAYMHTNYNGSSFWLGASDNEEPNTWLWQSGEKIQKNFPWGINPHNSTQPLGPRQHCMVLKYFKNINRNLYVDNKCKNKWRYICEIPSETKIGSVECNPGCEHGICTDRNICQCDQGYTGPACDVPLCTPTCKHGTCENPNSCQCEDGYTGKDCDVPQCTPNCEHGFCTGPNSCQCDKGYTGEACDISECTPLCENGICSGPNNCECDEGYTGKACNMRCNHSVTADGDKWRYSWTSPGYDGVTFYPDTEYECTLSITIPAKFSMYVLTTKFQSSSVIFETRECSGDRITYTHSNGVFKKLYCGEVTGESFAEVAVHDTPKTFHITWTSVKDGHADLGWNMTMYGFVPRR